MDVRQLEISAQLRNQAVDGRVIGLVTSLMGQGRMVNCNATNLRRLKEVGLFLKVGTLIERLEGSTAQRLKRWDRVPDASLTVVVGGVLTGPWLSRGGSSAGWQSYGQVSGRDKSHTASSIPR